MGYIPKIIRQTDPLELPITVEEAKEHAIIEHSDNDAAIRSFIAAATEYWQHTSGNSVVRQKWRLYLNDFYDAMRLENGPVQSIEQIQYIDTDGNTQTLASSYYSFNAVEPFVRLAYDQSWPTVRNDYNVVWVDYWSGYFDATASPIDLQAKIPADVKQGIMTLVALCDRNREAYEDIQMFKAPAFAMAIGPHRRLLR